MSLMRALLAGPAGGVTREFPEVKHVVAQAQASGTRFHTGLLPPVHYPIESALLQKLGKGLINFYV